MNVRKAHRKRLDDKQLAVEEKIVEDLFYDMYRYRSRVYRVNFLRGLFFGLGSVLGGTVVIAIVVWLLSWLIGVPGIGHLVSDIIENINSR